MRKNKYCKTARDLAKVVCNLMNLFYKKKEAGAFKIELLLSIKEIAFKGNRWELK